MTPVANELPERPIWKIAEDDVIHATWIERDRAHLALYLRQEEDVLDYGADLADWWDDDLRSLQEDGFLSARDWKGSGFSYAKDTGRFADIETKVNAALGLVWDASMERVAAATEGDVSYLLRADEAIFEAFSTLPWSMKTTVREAMQDVLDGRPSKVVGHQILGPDGYNVHGEDDDPFGMSSYAVLVGEAVEQAKSWVAGNPGYTVAVVEDGDVEEPTFVAVLPEPRVVKTMGPSRL